MVQVAMKENRIIGDLWDSYFDMHGQPNEAAQIFANKNGREARELRRYVDEDGIEYGCFRWESEQPVDPPVKAPVAPQEPRSQSNGVTAPLEAPKPAERVRIVLLDPKMTADKKKLALMKQCPDLTGAEIEDILKSSE